ncbi:hypothetical protein FB567DRAFT_533479 [Paraphoma chrysanthemicola]|uniref:Heterokaryon incompatibility domain-containing protein n=1 Tax=Paraphoma chrysanthemicola TaxID=798071 RepID=A0A8K0QX94_9PLEO|nr:hypothetical protein FB567DRAFT_533479 [Paraphoma chrysanthemicola]
MASSYAQNRSSFFTNPTSSPQFHGTEDDQEWLEDADENLELCSICENINFRPLFFGLNQNWRGDPISLGTIDAFLPRSTYCGLCSIVHDVLFQTKENEDAFFRCKDSSELKLNPIREGRVQVFMSNHMYGELLLHHEGFLANHPRPTDEYTHLSRLLREGEADIDLICSWILDCDIGHSQPGGCAGRKSTSEIQYPADLILIEVDPVSGGKLVRACGEERYLALSYVWGNASMLQTTTANFSSLAKDNALQLHGKQLPKVVKDAMELVRLLGEHYLWVDSLCIVQEDAKSKHRQI